MSDNEAEEQAYESANESEVSLNEEDLIEDNKDYNSDVEDSDEDEEKSAKKKALGQKKQPKKSRDKDDDEEDIDEAEDDDDTDEIEINFELMEESKSIQKKYSIIVDPRELEDHTKPNPRIKREIMVDRSKYKSSEYLTIYEFCELVGVRAQHVSDGAYVYVEIEAETSARAIAKKELQLGCCPFLIKRYMTPMNYDPVYVEIWNPNEMAIDPKFFDN